MDEPVRLTMPDGTVIWARVDGAAAQPAAGRPGHDGESGQTAAATGTSSGFAAPSPAARLADGQIAGRADGGAASDVSFRLRGRDQAGQQPSPLANFAETVKSVAATVHDAVVSQAPSGVSVEFGLELSMQTGQFVAVLAQAGVKTSVTVRLEWDREALAAVRVGTAAADGASAGPVAQVPQPAAGE